MKVLRKFSSLFLSFSFSLSVSFSFFSHARFRKNLLINNNLLELSFIQLHKKRYERSFRDVLHLLKTWHPCNRLYTSSLTLSFLPRLQMIIGNRVCDFLHQNLTNAAAVAACSFFDPFVRAETLIMAQPRLARIKTTIDVKYEQYDRA